jgi:hypothetical protein
MKKNILLSCLLLFVSFYFNAMAQALVFDWVKQMGGPSNELSQGISLDTDGNLYATGYFQNTVDFDPGAGNFNLTTAGAWDAYIFKLNPAGDFVWAKRMGGTNFDEAYSIATDAEANVYITGYFHDTVDFDPGTGTFNLTSAGYEDIFISKLDSSGNFLWACRIGSTSDDRGRCITTDAWGNVYVAGFFYGTVDFDPGPGTFNLTSTPAFADLFILKLDALGNFLWAKQMEGSNYENVNSITTDVSGDVYTTGYFSFTADFDPAPSVFNLTASGLWDIFVSKIDSSGNFIWADGLGGTGYEEGNSITTDSIGNVYITGYFNDTADFDPDSGVFNLVSAGMRDIFVLKLNSSGGLLWANKIGQANDDEGYSIVCDAAANIYTTGYFNGTVDFDAGPGTFNLNSAGAEDIFVSKSGAAGNFIWGVNMGGLSYEEGRAVAINSSGDVYSAGYFQSIADFDPSAGIYNLTATLSDIFVHKLSQLSIGIIDNNSSKALIIYPNPTLKFFTVSLRTQSSINNSQLQILDVMGRVVHEQTLTNQSTIIDKQFSAGIYFVKVRAGEKVFTEKLVVE